MLVHCCNWLLTETQCKIIPVQHVRRPELFKNLCLSLVSGVPHFFLGLHPCVSPHAYLTNRISNFTLPTAVALAYSDGDAMRYVRHVLWITLCSRCLPGSRVVSVLDSGAVEPGFKSQPRRCRGGLTVLGKLFTPIVPLFTKQRNW